MPQQEWPDIIGSRAVPTWSRRRVLQSLGMTGFAWSLGGCPSPAPRPLPTCAGTSAAAHARIDAHVHIFNGTDLQIAGFLKTSVANEYPTLRGILGWIAQPLQDFVWSNSPTASHELDKLNGLAATRGPRALLQSSVEQSLQADRAETAAQYSEFLRQQLGRPEVRAELSRLLSLSGAAPRSESKQRLRAPPEDGPTARSLARVFDAESGIPLFDYLEPYFSYRYANFFELVDEFTCHRQADIDTFVTHLLDFDEPLGGHGAVTRSPIDDQTAVVSKICQLTAGRLLAFAPYCPFKDVARHGESLANVLTAWSRPGFVGVKFYPPMGFYPYGNGGKLDVALARLYHECTVRDAAVMAHAGPSLCVTAGDCGFPGPDGWDQALTYVFATERKALRVSFGHFGGPFDTGSQSNVWPEKFVSLMEKPSGENAYADLAYASEVLQPSDDQAVVRRLGDLLTATSSPLSERLIYGTDWLMLGLEPQWRDYAARMEVVIGKTESATGAIGLSGRFFGTNARAWLALDRSGSLSSVNAAAL